MLNQRLRELNRKLLPVHVTGAVVGYQVNRNRAGWVVELVNNAAGAKQPDRPPVIDPRAVARARLRPRVTVARAVEWRLTGDRTVDLSEPITLGPGESVFVELALPEP